MDDDALDALRRFPPEDVEWIEPPARVWAAIEAELADASPAPPPTLADRRRQTPWRRVGLLVAAAAAAVVAVAVTVAVLRPADDDVVAEATLEPLVPGVGGDVRLVAIDGSLELRLSAAGLPPPDGFYEVWLIDPTVSRLVSLGPLREDGRYEVPPGVDPHAFPIVDVSEEPADGTPTHSGASVLRSELEFLA